MTNFRKLTAYDLPIANTLVWIKRKDGGFYLGYRVDYPLATNEDASRDCYWYANSSDSLLKAYLRKLQFENNFSDVTVDSWAYVESPK